MPTPSDNTPQLTPTPLAEQISTRTTCPPEVERIPSWRTLSDEQIANGNVAEDGAVPATNAAAHPALSRPDGGVADSAAGSLGMIETTSGSSNKEMAQSEEEPVAGTLSPASLATETKEEQQTPATQSSSVTATSATSAMLSYEFSNIRVCSLRNFVLSHFIDKDKLFPNYSSSFLRAGSKFVGIQRSDRQKYNVDVEIKYVDMAESYLCGYLRIQGLTEDHPTLTTFFEGEMIGPKYSFQTRHEAWGATDKIDMHHWGKFDEWRPYAKHSKKPDFTIRNFAQRQHIFMRWKEYFLVPDHRVRTISGASFEGFYYICFNQVEGIVKGIYFHAKSEKYQQLELTRVEDRGCLPAIEFR